MATTNKDLALPVYNSAGWNTPLNANFTDIDDAFGGRTIKNPTGISGTVVLTANDYTPPILIIGTSLTGTATLTANVTYQIPSGVGGFWYVYNNTTGNYTVSISSGGGGTSIALGQGVTTIIISDGTNIGIGNTNTVAKAVSASTVTGTAFAIGYLQIPQSTNTTAAASDVGKHIYVGSSVTINASIFSAGDSFVIVNSNTATTSISIIGGSGVTLRIAGTTTSGTPRSLAPNGMVSVLCVVGGATPTFLISGAGLS
jgi:hypothetical protein